jgi:hypothetical protein
MPCCVFCQCFKKTVVKINTTQKTVVSKRILVLKPAGADRDQKATATSHPKENPQGRQTTYKRPLFGHFVWDTVKAPSTYVGLPI